MMYTSTRNAGAERVSAAVAIKQGLASDGGLFMPESIPTLTAEDIAHLRTLDYPARAAFILGKFLTDYTADELLADCAAAYAPEKFPGGAVPIVQIEDGIYSLELWHGPTCAFKDMALQIMPRLLSRALQKTGETRTALILVATSGDTGKAALEGYRDVPQVKIQVFYPVDGVSRVQKLQMMTQEGSNVAVTAIRGNFDDAQTGVKTIFSDKDIRAALNRHNVFLSSANSINWGRLAPQIAYYVSGYCDLCEKGVIEQGQEMDVCVPTGNFGNIFAAFIAKRMGLPIGHLVCASNSNNVLTDFLTTGTYDRNRPFHATMSPSMDILISSNLERLLYVMFGSEVTARFMKELSEKGCYSLTKEQLALVQAHFSGYFADEAETAGTIGDTFRNNGYLCDTHTAVGLSAARRYRADSASPAPLLLASTASPYKFAVDVYAAVTGEKAKDELSALEQLAETTGTQIPAPLAGIGQRTIRFDAVTDASEMPKVVLAFAEKNG